MAVIVSTSFAVRFLECLLFATLVTLMPVLGLRWRQYAFGIATGFGVYATIALMATARFSILGMKFVFPWGWALLISYTCAVLIWLWFFSVAEKPPPPGGTSVLAFQELKPYRKILRRINKL
jgi:hypothetical protein